MLESIIKNGITQELKKHLKADITLTIFNDNLIVLIQTDCLITYTHRIRHISKLYYGMTSKEISITIIDSYHDYLSKLFFK